MKKFNRNNNHHIDCISAALAYEAKKDYDSAILFYKAAAMSATAHGDILTSLNSLINAAELAALQGTRTNNLSYYYHESASLYKEIAEKYIELGNSTGKDAFLYKKALCFYEKATKLIQVGVHNPYLIRIKQLEDYINGTLGQKNRSYEYSSNKNFNYAGNGFFISSDYKEENNEVRCVDPFKFIEENESFEIYNIDDQYSISLSLKPEALLYDEPFLEIFKERALKNQHSITNKNSFCFYLYYDEQNSKQAYISISTEKKDLITKLRNQIEEKHSSLLNDVNNFKK